MSSATEDSRLLFQLLAPPSWKTVRSMMLITPFTKKKLTPFPHGQVAFFICFLDLLLGGTKLPWVILAPRGMLFLGSFTANTITLGVGGPLRVTSPHCHIKNGGKRGLRRVNKQTLIPLRLRGVHFASTCSNYLKKSNVMVYSTGWPAMRNMMINYTAQYHNCYIF